MNFLKSKVLFVTSKCGIYFWKITVFFPINIYSSIYSLGECDLHRRKRVLVKFNFDELSLLMKGWTSLRLGGCCGWFKPVTFNRTSRKASWCIPKSRLWVISATSIWWLTRRFASFTMKRADFWPYASVRWFGLFNFSDISLT